MAEVKPAADDTKDQKDVAAAADPNPMDLALRGVEVFAKRHPSPSGIKQCITLACGQVGRLCPAAVGALSALAEFGKGNLDRWIRGRVASH